MPEIPDPLSPCLHLVSVTCSDYDTLQGICQDKSKMETGVGQEGEHRFEFGCVLPGSQSEKEASLHHFHECSENTRAP